MFPGQPKGKISSCYCRYVVIPKSLCIYACHLYGMALIRTLDII